MAARILGVDALDEAIAELRHEANFYFRHGGAELRDRFLDDLEHALARIAEAPHSFPIWPRRPTVRRVLLERFPFAVGFVVAPAGGDDPPLVVAVAHFRRRPGYWRRRVLQSKPR